MTTSPTKAGAQFTAEQIADFRNFERVRSSGIANMLEPKAQRATGLDTSEYLFVLKNYKALAAAAHGDAS